MIWERIRKKGGYMRTQCCVKIEEKKAGRKCENISESLRRSKERKWTHKLEEKRRLGAVSNRYKRKNLMKGCWSIRARKRGNKRQLDETAIQERIKKELHSHKREKEDRLYIFNIRCSSFQLVGVS